MKKLRILLTLIFAVACCYTFEMTAFADVTVINQNFDTWDSLSNETNWNFPNNSTQLSDGKNGGKALKLTTGENNGSAWFSYKLEHTVSSGTVKISYSVRPGENISTHLTAYNSDKTEDFTTLFMQKTGIFASGVCYTDYKAYDFPDKFDLDKWYDVTAIINLDTGYADVKVTDGSGNVYSSKNDRHSIKTIDHVTFQIWSEANCSSYLDNFTISKVSAAISYSDIGYGNITNETPVCNVTLNNYTSNVANAAVSWNIYDTNDTLLKSDSTTAVIKANSTGVAELNIDPGKYGVFYVKINASISGRQSGRSYAVTDEKKIDFSKVMKTENNNGYIGACYDYRGGEPDKVIEIADMGGYSGFRFAIYWGDVEKEKGKYIIDERLTNWIEKTKNAGMDIVVCLMGDNSLYFDNMPQSGTNMPKTDEQIKGYAEFCANVASQLKGKVNNFEIWNEPSVQGFNMNHVYGYTYSKIVKAASEAVKRENPDAKILILGGGSYDYLVKSVETDINDTLYGVRPNILDYCDAISIHPYDHSDGFKGFPDEWINEVTKFTEYLKSINKKIPLWITEYGWSTYDDSNYDNPWHEPVTYEEQALNLVGSAVILKSYGYVDKIFIYSFVDVGTDDEEAEDRWGILTNFNETSDGGYHAKNAYVALGALNHFISKGMTPKRIIADKNTLKNGAHIFLADDGSSLTVLWSETEKTKLLKADCETVEVYDMYGNKTASLTDENGVFAVNTGNEPVYIAGRYSDLEILDDNAFYVSDCRYDGNKNMVIVKGGARYLKSVDIELLKDGQNVETYQTNVKKDGTFEMFFSPKADGNCSVRVGRSALGGAADGYTKAIAVQRNTKKAYESYVSGVNFVGADKSTGKINITASIDTNDDNEECIVLVKRNDNTTASAENTVYVGTFGISGGVLDCEFKIPKDKLNGVYDLYIAPSNGESEKQLYSIDTFKILSLDMMLSDKIAVSVAFTNSTEISESAVMILTQYNDKGEIIRADCRNAAFSPVNMSSMTFETDKAENAVSYKAFIWDSVSDMKPLFKNIEKTEVNKGCTE